VIRVITNNTPLRYLVFLGYETILRDLFTHLLVPQAVVNELQRPKTPARVRTWMASPPPWLEIRQPVRTPDPVLLQFGAGERDTLLLAEELQADLVLLDERDAHAEAIRRGFATFGTLRLLEMAAQRHLLDLPTALTALAATTFYMDDALVQDLLARDAARKRQDL
jgi:predicted nucleic acid-binding protein